MVHKFSMFGTNLALDVYSGSVHIFDDVSFDVLDLYENMGESDVLSALSGKYTEESIKEAYLEIDSLKNEGILFSEDEFQSMDFPMADPVVKAICIHISHDCNIRCRYCFAGTGSFGGDRMNMPSMTGKKAIDFLISMSGKRRNLEIDFFGGEPLLNFDVVKDIVSYAKSKEEEYGKKFKFTLTTNAVMLDDEKMDYINKNMQNVVLSIDGRRDVNDRMRKRIDGKGTYDGIIHKIKQMADARNQDNYYVRGTYTRENIDFSNDVLHLADLGFKQISVEPVVAAKDTGFDIREEDLPELFSEYEKLAHEYVKRKNDGNGFNFFHFIVDLEGGPCISKRLGGCGSGHEYVAVTPSGDIYPCHQFVGMDEFHMGNVNEEGIKKDVQKAFKNSNVYTKEECKSCWAKFFCSGGCAANSMQFHGNINTPYKIGCELEKKRVECALWIKSQLQD
ncbi:MAG TPA: thioether cross-link-forming SCIFF peptide maturase [Clostridia bacterium]